MSNTEKKRIRFIANPISGTKSKTKLADLIYQFLDHAIYDYEVIFTEFPKHATQLSQEAATSGYYAVVAVGGDGTINEVAKGIINTSTALGILPFGSGNGLAYHLGIKRNIKKAFQIINEITAIKIDTGSANERFFINVAGLGLDATVAYKTKLNTKRGFMPYFINTIKESFGFKFLDLQIMVNGKEWTGKYAMAVIANGSIYGYDFTVAPEAKLDDGMFDVLLVKKAAIYKYFFLVPRMFNKTFHKSPLIEYFKTSDITIHNDSGGYFHVDGEGKISDRSIRFLVNPHSLTLLISN